MAIVNGKSGKIEIATANQYIKGYIQWQETYDDASYISTNETKVTMNVYLHRINVYNDITEIGPSVDITQIGYCGTHKFTDSTKSYLKIAGSSTTGTATSGGGAFTNVFTWSWDILHNNDGTWSGALGFEMSNNSSVTTAKNAFTVSKTTQTITLTTIPRYSSVNQSLKSKTETSITMNWSSDNTVDYIWYSTNNGSSWTGLDVTDGKSGSYTISGLSAETYYEIKTRVRRKDSQLTSDSSAYGVTTYNYPYCTSSPDFTIGDTLTLTLYNPLSRSVTIKGYSKNDGREIFGGTSNGTSISGFNDSGSINSQYASIPNSKNAPYKVVVSYGNVAMTRDAGNTYKIRGNEYPTINAVDYIDENPTTTAITRDATKIVQGLSSLQVRFHSATANYGAGGISAYVISCNGTNKIVALEGAYSLGAVNSANDVELTLAVTDSRGMMAKKTITVSVLEYSDPTAKVTLERYNNSEDLTALKVDGSVSSVNGNNTMAIKYRYKLSGGSYGSYTTIEDNAVQYFTLDKNNVYIFNVVVTDAFGHTFNKEYELGKGTFPLFIDTVKNSVGINCFPKEQKSFEVNGLNVFRVASQFDNSRKQIYLGNGGGLMITFKSVNISDKIPVVITGIDNSSSTPVFTIITYYTNGGVSLHNLGTPLTVIRRENILSFNASQYSFYIVEVPLGCEIELSNDTI